MSSQKRQSYTLNYKLEAVKFAVDNSLAKAAEHFRVNISQIRRWKKQQVEMEAATKKEGNVVKRKRSAKYPAIEAHMKTWIAAQRKEGHPVSGTVIKREAKAHAIRMKINDFKGSCCWVSNFMKRNGVVRRAVTSVGQKHTKK